MKQDIITYLNVLLSHNVIGDRQYKNRFNGFVGELDFREWFLLNRLWEQHYNGGFLLPTVEKANALDNPIYFTTSTEDPQEYQEIYRRISKLDCKAMYYIQWDSSTPFGKWKKEDLLGVGILLPVPSFLVYVYDVGQDKFIPTIIDEFLDQYNTQEKELKDNVDIEIKSHFSELLNRFDDHAILDLYVQRLFFDGFIGFKKVRGIPSDVDMIIRSKGGGQLIAFEVKEKDLSKTKPQGFGMDVPRIAFFETFMGKTGIDVYYFVKQIDNQSSRKIIAWRAIHMHDFIKHVGKKSIEGGTGMRSSSSYNPTYICPEKYFRDLL